MDGGDDRLLVAEDAHLLLLARWIGEIGAGAERLALRREHGAADLDVAIELLQRIRDLVDQGDVEEIERRLSYFYQADMIVLLDADVSELCHEVSSFDQRNPSPRAMMPRSTSVVPP